MTTTRPITELDFDNIKTELISFIRNNPTFSDYNFEGSALNAIIDILAFNTHNNAYYANMVHNESFLDTAQKRSSVVSRAKELGYTPKSVTGSTAFIDIGVLDADQAYQSFWLPRGTEFSSTNDNGTFKFLTPESMKSTLVDGVHTFQNVKIVNGMSVQNYFTVNTMSNVKSMFTIPNVTIDTSTLKVYVKESINAVERVQYSLAENVYGLTSASKVFFLQESYDGHYQIYFGENILGVQPQNGNVIEIDYFVNENFNLADSCRTFSFSGVIGTFSSVEITTVQSSFGGSGKETIDSIKYNAVKSNSAKNRAITTDDYIQILKDRFSFIDSVSVWGGEDNIPPVYGKVFVSVQPVSGYILTDAVKNTVLAPAIKSASPMTIRPEIVDPSYTYLDFYTKIKFNPNKTTTSQVDVENGIRYTIINYIDSISQYNTNYLESKLSSDIMALDAGISSVDIDKRGYVKLSPQIGVETSHSRRTNNPIIGGSISSTKFIVNYDTPKTVGIKEISGKSYYSSNSKGISEILQPLGLYTIDGILVREIGVVNLTTGKFDISFGVYNYLSNNRFVKMSFEFVEDDVVVERNQILVIESNNVDSSIGLTSNNIISTEIYDK